MTTTNLWKQFYDQVKDPSWPECINETEFVDLPPHIQQEILDVHGGQAYIRLGEDDVLQLSNTEIEDCSPDIAYTEPLIPIKIAKDFEVFHNSYLNGGGLSMGQNYPRIINFLYPNRKFEHCLEWCAGPGYIGYRLLSDGICQDLFLFDKYQPAIEAAKKTRSNVPARCQGQVQILQGSKLQDIPTNNKFDLVVANPPHFKSILFAFDQHQATKNRLAVDEDWKCHQDFFANIKNYLSPDGVIVLQENSMGSSIYEFQDYIANGGLEVRRTIVEKNLLGFWYLEIGHAK